MSFSVDKKHRIAILLIAFIFAVLYDWLFNVPFLGFNFFIFSLVVVATLLIVRLAMTRKLANNWSLLLIIPILWYAGSVAVYESDFVKIVAPLATIFLFVLFLFWSGADGWILKKVKRIIPPAIFRFLAMCLGNLIEPWKAFSRAKIKSSSKIILAILITLPLVLLFIGLFASADLVFRNMLTDMFDWEIEVESLSQVVRIALLTFLFGGVVFTYIFEKRFVPKKKTKLDKIADNRNKDEDRIKPNDESAPKKDKAVIPTIILGTLNALFAVFIVIQLMFLFGGHEIIEKYDITYADYVHQGFYQMVAIALLVLIISYAIFRFYKSDKLDFVKILNALFIGQALIIVASALKRMFLYQEAYGQTQLRFLVWHFIIYIGLILLSLLVVLLLKKKYYLFMKVGLVISIVYLMFMTGINMQARIAEVNIDRYVSGQDDELDIQYLKLLSPDIYEQISRPDIGENKKDRAYFSIWEENQEATMANTDWKGMSISKMKYLTGEDIEK